MEILAIIKGDNALLAALAALFGLVVGSFLNVVIYRLPLMLDRTWRQDCEEFLHLQPSPNDEPAMNLIVPRSRCPQCGHGIRAHENIPVLSYLVLRGRCASCGGAISLRYPA
ncbi:MAG: type pilus prepilin peptidase PilD, partial [Proteobacteria bacterium]|nr:type pilus prepilin peptidase PilD [Pseudomonadota bacterium]